MTRPAPLDHTPPRMMVEERRRLIVERVREQGRATVNELSKHFHTSAVTIRGDLEALSRTGAVTRSHGGALPTDVNQIDAPLNVKEVRRMAEKRRIGAAAAQMISDGETIILDSGTTTVEIARQIRQRKWHSLTVITNALNIAMELNGMDGVRVMILGGLLRPNAGALVGPDAEQTLSKLSADRLFLGVDGLDPKIGVTTPDPQEATLNQLMVTVSRETVAVLDATKLGRRTLSVIVPVSDLDTIITDASAPKSITDALRKQGVQVTVV